MEQVWDHVGLATANVSKLLKLDGEMTAVSLGDRSELPDAIRAIIEAVRAGDLDLAIEEVAEKSIPDISLRRSGRGIGS